MKFFGKIKSKKNHKEYDLWIEFDEEGNLIEYNCTCFHGSIYRFSKKAKKNKEVCWHLIELIRKIKFTNNGGSKNGKKKEEINIQTQEVGIT